MEFKPISCGFVKILTLHDVDVSPNPFARVWEVREVTL